MTNKRWVATTGYTLYDEIGREYILYTKDYDEALENIGSYRETMEGVEFVDLDNQIVIISWDELELDFD